MEETEFLQDILECSVCLNSLTEQNKVLPCQHTFCVQCLAEILQTQNELRCPECRILYKGITNLDELPSNILLIRLLEGLKQNMRIKNNRLIKTPNQTPMKQFGKFSILPHQQSTSNLQRQFLTNRTGSDLQQLSTSSNLSTSSLIQQQQCIAPRQLQPSSNNNHSFIYGNVNNLPQLPSNIQYPQPQATNRRNQLNLENTLVKQQNSFVQDVQTMNALQQTAPKTIKTPTSSITPNLPSSTQSTSSINSSNNLKDLNSISSTTNQQQWASKPIMCNAIALCDSNQIGNWSIKKNDILFIKENINLYWYLAIFNGIQGVVPVSFVELIPNSNKTLPHPYSTLPTSMNSMVYQPINNTNNLNRPPSTAAHALQQAQSIGVQLPLPQQYFNQFTLCRALYDFNLVADINCQNCLSFKKNDLINLIRRVDENWLEGSLNNNIGILPLTFVEFLPTIRPATRSSSQNSCSNVTVHQSSSIQTNNQHKALPTPPVYQRIQSSSNSSTTNHHRLLNINHSRSNSINNSINNNSANKTDAMSHFRTNSKNGQSSNQQRCNSTNPKSIDSNAQINCESNLSFGNLTTSSNLQSGHSNSNSYDNLLDIKPNQQSNLYIALYNYQPQKADELELKKNELYIVYEKYVDNWYKGQSLKTNATGVFPGNYLLPARNNNTQHLSSYQNVIANRRSFGNLSSTTKFDSADNLSGTTNGSMNPLTKPKQLTSSIDNNLSDLNNTITKMKSENYLNNDQMKNEQSNSGQQHTISKSVEQLNNDNSTYENLLVKKNIKKNDDLGHSTSNEGSPQWIQPKVAATRLVNNKQKNFNNNNSMVSKQTSQSDSPYSFVLNNDLTNEFTQLRIEITTNSNNTTHVIKEVINTPIKKEEKKTVNLIRMFTGKRSSNKIDKHRNFSCDNPTFVDISPKN